MKLYYPTLAYVNEHFGTNLRQFEIPFKWHKNNEDILVKASDEFSDKCDILGLNLPVLITPDNDSDKYVIIVGQDPLRAISKYSKYSRKELTSNYILGLSYNVQAEPKGNEIIMHGDVDDDSPFDGVITSLIKEGYSVYITNAYKVYAGKYNQNGEQVSCLNFSGKTFNRFADVLKEELSAIRLNLGAPEKIVLFGSIAQKMSNVLNLQEQYDIVNIPHTSGRNLFWNGTTYKERVNIILNKIKNN